MSLALLSEFCRERGATLEPYRDVQNGRQYHAVRGGERVLVTVYSGKKGETVHVDAACTGPLADELRDWLGGAKTPASPWAVWAGSDESGKGDFFGPLCVAAVRVTREQAAALVKAGVRDSKELGNDQALSLDRGIRKALPFAVARLDPEAYNAAYDGNLNRTLGKLHGDALAKVAAGAEALIVDKFGGERYVRGPLKELGVKTKLVMRVRAESDPAVAAASVVARAEFLLGLEALEEKFDMRFPPGASAEVEAAGRRFVKCFGREKLGLVAKLHFRTAARL